MYPIVPGPMWICVDSDSTVIRSGSGRNYPVVATVTNNVQVTSDRFRLYEQAEPGTESQQQVDGVGYYRIRWQGQVRWVASYRVADTDLGCTVWENSESEYPHK